MPTATWGSDSKVWSEIGYTKNGDFAEYSIAPEHLVYKVPDNLSLDVGALTAQMKLAK